MRPIRSGLPSPVARAIAFASLLWLAAGPHANAGNPANPILFVTQVPMPEEVNSRSLGQSYMSMVSPFSNHLADTAHAARGGSLMIRFTDGQVVDLLAVADWSAVPGGAPAANSVAVRNPDVHWSGTKAIFSMVIGVPSGPADTTSFLFQLYEITLPTQAQLNANVKPVITVVPNQPAYDNVFPVYALNGRIVFASDRPYNGASHLLQREEYLSLPTTTGLYSLDPTSASSLLLLHHAPSGAFSPTVDSSGRLVFSNWDHLARDTQAVTDSRAGVSAAPYNETFTQTTNGSGNFADESMAAAFTQVTAMAPNSWDVFPEPRNFDHVTLIDVYGGVINGNSQNLFMPWTVNLDGTGGEILNHVGRHEVGSTIPRSHKNDPNVVDLNPALNPGYGGLGVHNFFFNFLAPREDPLSPGTYYGADAADLGTHGAGQIVRLNNAGTLPNGSPTNPDAITVTYVTSGANALAKPALVPTVRPSINLPATGLSPLTAGNAETLYRTPLPLADGNLVASRAAGLTQTDYNVGTIAQPASLYTFRLCSLKPSGGTYVPDVVLTAGFNVNASYYVGPTLVTYSGALWELDPVEVVARTPPVAATSGVDPIEAAVFAQVGVDIPTFQSYLRAHNAALSVSRDVTRRDIHDRQQPFNLRVLWSNHQAVGTAGTVYDVAWIQFLQADLRRGYTMGGVTPIAGRRVVATPMHDTASENPPAAGAPPGSARLGDDGSFAAIVPAGKALTWHLTNNDAAYTSQVKERFWVTFQSGEIRTCANCHGINTSDQTGTIASPVTRPTNSPQALASLLSFWKAAHPSGTVQHTASGIGVLRDSGTVTLSVGRTGGGTGPASVDFTTQNGTASAGLDFTAQSGTLSWVDGDTSPKSIVVSLANRPISGAPIDFTVVLSSAHYATLGAATTATITLAEPNTGFDAGIMYVDAGVPTDAGTGTDSGATTDSGSLADAGSGPMTRVSDGCSCRVEGRGSATSDSASVALLGVALAAMRRRRISSRGRSPLAPSTQR